MGEISKYAFAALSGFAVGLFYFWGLRFTVQRYKSYKHPVLVFLLSFIVRTLCAFVVFYFVGRGDFSNYTLLLLGFILSRFFFVKKRQLV